MWIKRELNLPYWSQSEYTEIWDDEENYWQINYSSKRKLWILYDSSVPYWVPASPVHGSYDTLALAVSEAKDQGKNDPTIYHEYGVECGILDPVTFEEIPY